DLAEVVTGRGLDPVAVAGKYPPYDAIPCIDIRQLEIQLAICPGARLQYTEEGPFDIVQQQDDRVIAKSIETVGHRIPGHADLPRCGLLPLHAHEVAQASPGYAYGRIVQLKIGVVAHDALLQQ